MPEATGYTIRIAKDSKFHALVGTYNTTDPTFTPATSLPVGTVLYWEVMATGDNPSAWSAPWMLVEMGNPSCGSCHP